LGEGSNESRVLVRDINNHKYYCNNIVTNFIIHKYYCNNIVTNYFIIKLRYKLLRTAEGEGSAAVLRTAARCEQS